MLTLKGFDAVTRCGEPRSVTIAARSASLTEWSVRRHKIERYRVFRPGDPWSRPLAITRGVDAAELPYTYVTIHGAHSCSFGAEAERLTLQVWDCLPKRIYAVAHYVRRTRRGFTMDLAASIFDMDAASVQAWQRLVADAA